MSHDHREAIAEVLAEHEDYAITSNWDAAICRCGVKVCDLNDNATDADTPHRAHLADALLGSDVLAQIRADARAEERADHLTPDEIATLLVEARAEGWDARNKARPQYLGPDDGHYADECMGWEDCYCGTYPNPYCTGGSA